MYGMRIEDGRIDHRVERSARRIALRSRGNAREAELRRHAIEAAQSGGVEQPRSTPHPRRLRLAHDLYRARI